MGVELQVSVILFFALAGYLLSSRINQSAVVGVILIGILIGPSVLGIVRYTDAVKMLAHLGAILLLFSVGLEFRLHEVYRPNYICIAASGLVLPWIAGYATGAVFGYGFRESMFIGVSLTATSIAITAKVLEEMKKLNSAAAKAIIGAAVIDDILGLVALTVVEQLSKGGVSAAELVGTAAKAVTFLAAGIFSAPYVRKLFMIADGRDITGKFPDFLFIMAVMFCFLYASVAEMLGLSAIVGAFLCGAVLEGLRFRQGRGLKEGAEYLHIIFGAIFFISLGILANFRELSGRNFPFFAVLFAAAVAAKFLGCWIPSRLVGYTGREAVIIGFGMAPRGEVAMIVALIGLTSRSIGQDIYVAVVLMSLMTTILTPLVIGNLRWER